MFTTSVNHDNLLRQGLIAYRVLYTSTSRRYKCNKSDWIALVTGNILEMYNMNMALLLK